jgi:hypothetical protein
MNSTIQELMAMKPSEFRRKINGHYLVNIWLEEFFGNKLQEIEEDPSYEKDEYGNWVWESTQRFHNTYKVTPEQYEWWEKTTKEILASKIKGYKKRLDKDFCWISLQCGPSTIIED